MHLIPVQEVVLISKPVVTLSLYFPFGRRVVKRHLVLHRVKIIVLFLYFFFPSWPDDCGSRFAKQQDMALGMFIFLSVDLNPRFLYTP